jgi:hypothetical protein
MLPLSPIARVEGDFEIERTFFGERKGSFF